MNTSSPDKPAVALVGAGAVGTALAQRLTECGFPVQAVLSRTLESACRLADQVQASTATTTPHELPTAVRLLFVCVPDDALPEVAHSLAGAPPIGPHCLAAHTSGAHPAEVLAPLAETGARVLSFHPLQTFPDSAPPDAFSDIYVGLEGADEAIQEGRVIARDLGATPMTVPRDAKARYHLAASMASNFLVTLTGMAEEVLSSADLPAGASPLQPLLEGTVDNLAEHSPEQALTGPIARGDHSALVRHLDALASHAPHLVPAYAALALETVRLAVRGGKLNPEEAQTLLELLKEHTLSSSSGTAYNI